MREFIHKIILGFGFGMGAVICIVGGEPIYDFFNETPINYGDTTKYSLSEPYLVKSGKYLIFSGEVLGEKFEKVERINLWAEVKLDGNFIDNCYGQGYKLEKELIWSYLVECQNITKDYFDHPYDYHIYIENVILEDR